ncbi:MAG: hypothetical protein LH624_12955, partial [Cryobacterium sp.]|nr:hypothetical protein [Cryobacterium sp.]
MVRLAVALVHSPRRAQVVQCSAKEAMPLPSSRRRIETVTSLGQVTVSSSRSTLKRSLANSPPGRGAGGWGRLPEDSAPGVGGLQTGAPGEGQRHEKAERQTQAAPEKTWQQEEIRHFAKEPARR